jgi:hypothetical protein
MALQHFIGPWPLLQFRNVFHTVGRTSWTSDQPVARPLPMHRTTQTQNKCTDIHASSGIRSRDPGVPASEDTSCLRPSGHCGRLPIPIQFIIYRSPFHSTPYSLVFWRHNINHTKGMKKNLNDKL